MAATLSARLETTARALAQLYANGQITLDQLRDQMARAIAEAHTVAMLAGTDGQRNAEIDAALREIIADERAELDRLIELLNRGTVDDVERRLLLFGDSLGETFREGESLIAQDDVSPIVPIAVGIGLSELIRRLRQQPVTGQRLPRIDNRQLRLLQDEFEARIEALADDLANGVLTPDDWHQRMQRELRVIHETYAQLGGGSVNEQRIQRQLEFLDGFRGDVETLTPEQVKRRAKMYIGNGQATLQEAATARIGMPVLPAYPKDGSTICRTADKCFWDIQLLEGIGNWDVYWKLRPAEHCETCVRRAQVWNPIAIRNGVIQPYETTGVFA